MVIPEFADTFLAYCSRHRTPATMAFYRARLQRFCREFNGRELGSLTSLEIDEHLAKAGAGMSNSTRHHNVVALWEHKTARKTGKPRRIAIGRKLGELLERAIGTRTEGPVFLSPAGKAWVVPNLSRTYSRLRDYAGLSRELVLYLARHEFGTKICREKWIEFARRLLGHANVSTTQRYMHLDERELADAQDLVE